MVKNCRNVRGHEELVVPQPNYCRRAIAGRHNLIRLIHRNHCQGKYTGKQLHCLADRFLKAGAVPVSGFQKIVLYQVSNDFGVSLGGEAVPLILQLSLKRNVVLDNSVVHHHNSARTIPMRVSILFGRPSVRGPARVPDAICPVEWFDPDRLFEIAQFSFRAANLQPIPVARDGDPSRIVTAIFQPSQTFNDYRNYSLLADVADNSAH